MSKIHELIAELCPEGVPVLAFGDLVINRDNERSPVTRDLRLSGAYPYYGANGIQDHVEEFIFDGTFLLIGEDGSVIEADGAPVLNWAEGKIWVNNHAHVLQEKPDGPNLRYLYFYLSTINVSGFVTGGSQKKINQGNLNKIPIPLPPIEVQREIVSILDKFIQLGAELEAELEARKSQFTYFVDRIFDLDGSHNAPSEPLKSACRITRASGLEKSQLQGEGLPVVQYGEIHMHYDTVATSSRSFADPLIAGKLQRANPGDVILVTTSEDVKDVGNPLVWLGSTPIGVGGESLIMEHDLDPVYLGMFFKSNSFYSQKLPYVNGSKVKRISTSNLQKILIPVPERGVQKMLGENLLALENLVKSASVGLPAEIAARRKQYEHCRNKLLTFKELETA